MGMIWNSPYIPIYARGGHSIGHRFPEAVVDLVRRIGLFTMINGATSMIPGSHVPQASNGLSLAP